MSIDDDVFYPYPRREKRIKDKDLYETVEEVFDTKTVMTLYNLMRRKIIKRMAGVISSGKEARVYLAYGPKNTPLAVKIYLTSTAMFKKGILKYIIGDPRFDGFKPRNTRALIYAWTRKEFRNLKRLYEAGVKVPKPITFLNNVLVMEFMGENGKRYPLLAEVYDELDKESLAEILDKILVELNKIVCKAKLVHSDLSEFNVMVTPDPDIVIIDVGQAVLLDHPNSMEFLIRDIMNLIRFFRDEVGIDTPNPDKVLEEIKSCLMKTRED